MKEKKIESAPVPPVDEAPAGLLVELKSLFGAVEAANLTLTSSSESTSSLPN